MYFYLLPQEKLNILKRHFLCHVRECLPVSVFLHLYVSGAYEGQKRDLILWNRSCGLP